MLWNDHPPDRHDDQHDVPGGDQVQDRRLARDVAMTWTDPLVKFSFAPGWQVPAGPGEVLLGDPRGGVRRRLDVVHAVAARAVGDLPRCPPGSARPWKLSLKLLKRSAESPYLAARFTEAWQGEQTCEETFCGATGRLRVLWRQDVVFAMAVRAGGGGGHPPGERDPVDAVRVLITHRRRGTSRRSSRCSPSPPASPGFDPLRISWLPWQSEQVAASVLPILIAVPCTLFS